MTDTLGDAGGRFVGHSTAGHRCFFEDGDLYRVLEHQILLSLVVTGRMEGSRTLRIWSVGCGTGEEPYAIAMLLHRLLRDRRAWTMSILAAESNPARLAVARRGCYPAASLRETPRDIRDRYFRRCGPEMYAVDPRIRSMVTFALLEAPAPAGIAPSLDAAGAHLILCRKWSGRRLPPRAQAAMGARFETALVPGGWLVPDPGLHPALVRPFVPVRFPAAVVYRKPLAAGPSAPTTPTSQRPAGTGRVISPRDPGTPRGELDQREDGDAHRMMRRRRRPSPSGRTHGRGCSRS